MADDQNTLRVEQNTGQQPFAKNGGDQSIQQTGSSENFGVVTDTQGTSQAEQDRLLELLRSEAAGQPYQTNTLDNGGINAWEIVGMAAVILILMGLFVFYFRLSKMKIRITH